MKRAATHSAFILFLLFTLMLTTPVRAQRPMHEKILRNNDILLMTGAKIAPEVIVAKIKISPCVFDTFPPVVKSLKSRGVPNSVLQAMIEAPSGPSTSSRPVRAPKPPNFVEVRVPAGTPVEVETIRAISSSDFKEVGDIRFRVTRSVSVNGMTVIPSGALATARVTDIKERGRWGRAGEIAWNMQAVVAVDGKRIPLKFEQLTRGEDKEKTVATGAAITAAVTGVSLIPATPIALLWGLVKGGHASISAGQTFRAIVHEDVLVRAVEPQEKPTVYHSANAHKQVNEPNTEPLRRLERESILRPD